MVSAGGSRSKQSSQGTQQSTTASQSGASGWSQSGAEGGSEQSVWGQQSPALGALYQQAQQLLGGQGGFASGAQGVANDARGAWLQQLTPGGNPYFSGAMQASIDQATQSFNRDVLPGLREQGVAADAYGNPRQGMAEQTAAGDFGRSLGQSVTQGYAQQYGADQQRALQALGMGGQIQGMQTQPLQLAGALIGGPTVLGQSFNRAGSQSGNSAFSNSVGQSTGQQSASGNSRSLNFGIGSK